MGFIVSRSPLSPALDVFQHELGGGRRNLRSSPSNGKSSLVVAPACEPLDIDLPLQFRNLRARRIDDRTPIRRETAVVDVGSRLRKLLGTRAIHVRSEEHTSELQSLMRISYAAFCLKKIKPTAQTHNKHTILSLTTDTTSFTHN